MNRAKIKYTIQIRKILKRMKLFNFFKKSSNQPKVPSTPDEILLLTWNSLNADILSTYLSDDFRCDAIWCEAPIIGRDNYINHLKQKFQIFKNTGKVPVADFIIENGQKKIRITSNKEQEPTTIVDITYKGDKIAHLYMRVPLEVSIIEDEEWEAYATLYEEMLGLGIQIAGQSIEEFVTTKGLKKNNSMHQDFTWIATQYGQHSFQHLCFRYMSDIYSVIVAMHGFSYDGTPNDTIVVPRYMYERLIHEAEKNNLIPCICPVALHSKTPLAGGTHLIHAITHEIVSIYSKNTSKVLMSEWELNNMGIHYICNELTEKGIHNISYCDTVGLYPQIWFEDKGKWSYIIVRSTAVGNKNKKFVINKRLISHYKDCNGYFANLLLASSNSILYDDKGQIVPLSKRDTEGDIWLWRGDGFYVHYTGIQEILKAVESNQFIVLMDDEMHKV